MKKAIGSDTIGPQQERSGWVRGWPLTPHPSLAPCAALTDGWSGWVCVWPLTPLAKPRCVRGSDRSLRARVWILSLLCRDAIQPVDRWDVERPTGDRRGPHNLGLEVVRGDDLRLVAGLE